MLNLKLLALVFFLIDLVNSHGFLIRPPARNSAWAYLPGFQEYKDDLTALYCGTLEHQYYFNDGKCGVCGDEHRSTNKLFEYPGKYATEKIVETYVQGQEINITHSTVADLSHGGSVEVKLCPISGSMKEATQECLDANVLEVVPNSRSITNEKFKVTVESTPPPGKPSPAFVEYSYKVKLPAWINCDRCVLQWTWINDNRKALLLNGTEVKGIGAQQKFVNCADVQIKPNRSGAKAPITKPIRPAEKVIKPVYQCETWKHKIQGQSTLKRNTSPDPNKYTGSGVICFNEKEDVWGSDASIKAYVDWCVKCFTNCMSPAQACPSDCFCRWYP